MTLEEVKTAVANTKKGDGEKRKRRNISPDPVLYERLVAFGKSQHPPVAASRLLDQAIAEFLARQAK